MNRREFLFRTSAVTSALVAAPAIALTPAPPPPPPPPADPFEILSPDEIKAWLGRDHYVSAPCFTHMYVKDGKLDSVPYLIKTYKLRGVLKSTDLNPKSVWIGKAQQLAKEQIQRLGLTHLHSVRLWDIPFTTSEGSMIHFMFCRGAIARDL